ncbi:MAG: ABC transporter permease [Dehalococcoidia bacterium]
MTKFVLRRILVAIPTLVAISIIIFTILQLAPGDPFGQLALNPDVPPEVRANLRKQYHLDDPIPVQYVGWATQAIKGNWGFSFVSRVNVLELIRQRLPTTIMIVGSAYLIALAIAIPVGILSAVKQYSAVDNIATTLAFLGYSLPTFFTGLLFILFFSIYLRWLPFIYTADIQASGLSYLWQLFQHAVMPIMVLALFQAASLTRYVRASMLDVIRQDYVRTARAKGMREIRVTLTHAFRNALIPVVTIIALDIPTIFTGALITEQIFRVPGIGSLLINSLQSKDTPVIMFIVFTYAILVVIFTLLADIMYGVLDPRVKFA